MEVLVDGESDAPVRQLGADGVAVGAEDDDRPAGPRGQGRPHNSAHDRRVAEGQEELLRAHAPGLARRQDHGPNRASHLRSASLSLLRTDTSSAAMLTANSSTVLDPMSRPIGACTRAHSSAVAQPLPRNSPRMTSIFGLLPIIPM